MKTIGRTSIGMVGKSRLVYILAASHSGSTLLGMLLGRHPEVCTVGELKLTSMGDIERYRCSCRALIRECFFWARVREEMGHRGFPFDVGNPGTHIGAVDSSYIGRLLKPLHRGPFVERIRDAALALSPNWRSHYGRVQATNAALAETLCVLTGKKVVVDSSKVGIRLKYLLRNPKLDVRVIRLVRDGRGVALTYTDPSGFADASDPRFRGGGTGEGRESERLGIAEAAMEWLRSNQEAEILLRGIDPMRRIEVRYELLCSDPESILRKLFAFMNVDSNGSVCDFPFREHHVIGNGMRLDGSPEVRLDERWKAVLTPGDLATFESVAGGMNRKLGYA